MDYYKKVITNYTGFSGRARRKEYWMFTLVNALIGLALGIIEGIINMKDVLSGLYSLAVLIPSLAVSFRRLHDTGRSAWWLLLVLVPIIGWIALLVFLVQDSQPGTNVYGPNPKEGMPTPPAPPMIPAAPIEPIDPAQTM